MSFLLRVALVIGVLSYLAVQRQGTGSVGALTPDAETARANLSAAIAGLPSEMRDRAAKTIADAAAGEVARRLAGARASRDTLSENDRRPSWHGGEGR